MAASNSATTCTGGTALARAVSRRSPLWVSQRRQLPAIVFAIVASTGDIHAGLWYPILVAAMSVVP